MAESRQRWRVLGRWRDRGPWWLLRTAVLVGLGALAGLVWLRWGLAGLAIAGGIALVGGLIVWAVVMPGRLAPPVPTETLAEIADAKDRLEVSDARTRLHHDLRNGALQLLTVLAVLVGAGLGFQQLAEDRNQARQDRQLTRQGQASERFTRAIDQLGSSRVETRIGGIFGLNQVAEQDPENTGPVGEVLLAWLNSRPRPKILPAAWLYDHAPDVQAALSVLTGQRYSPIVARRIDLHGLSLRGADLDDANLFAANLSGADLDLADLDGANLEVANLVGASLNVAELEGTDLDAADLRNADLDAADLRHADMQGADLRGARLGHANLGGADLRTADLSGANLGGADLRHADLGNADLRAADLRDANLRDANLQGAKIDGSTRGPSGFDWHRVGARVVAP